MSASVKVSSPVAVSTPSSKKRKHAGHSEKSSKKRRHAEEEPEREADNVEVVSELAVKDKKKKKKKSKADVSAIEDEDQSIEQQEQSQGTISQFHEANGTLASNEDEDRSLLDSDELTSFSSVRISLNLPLPAVGLSNPKSSVLALHIAPLLLTYYAPAGGIVLAYTDAVLSDRPSPDADQADTIVTRMGDELGASWAWLTVTLLVFKPQSGDELGGWTNALSEGFIGLVSYNYFQTAVARNRIPSSWTWTGAYQSKQKQKKTPRKGKLNDDHSQGTVTDSQVTAVEHNHNETAAIDEFAGSFVDESGDKIGDTLNFRVLDVEMVPAHERGRWTLQIDGTLLDEAEEARVREEELREDENRQRGTRSRSETPGTLETSSAGAPFMSGGMGPESRAPSPAGSAESELEPYDDTES